MSKVQEPMESVEVTAKSLAEATKSAAEKLGVPEERIEATVIEETKGLFGKLNLRVRAHVKEAKTEPVEAPVAVAVVEPAQAAVAVKEKPKTSRRTRTKPEAENKAPAPEAAVEPVEAEAVAAADDEPEVVATPEDADRLADLLREIVGSAELQVTVKPTGINGRYVNLELDGKDVAFLVGKHGEVLNALQYLVNIIGNRKLTSGVRATLDGNHYRKRREDTLTQLAVEIAEQVKKRGEEAVLDALPAFERRIVHKALSTVTGISTYSEGEEPNRRVVIAPAE